jgi:hypothetical protein
MLVFLEISFLLAFPPITNMRSYSPNSRYLSCPSHPPRLYHSNYSWRGVKVTKLLVMQFFNLLLINFSSGFNTLFSNTFDHCSFFNVRDNVSHPHPQPQAKLQFCLLQFSSFEAPDEKTEVLDWMVERSKWIHSQVQGFPSNATLFQ